MAGYNPLAAVGEGYNFVQGIREGGARRKAGAALGQRDYGGAAAALGEEGMLEEAMKLQGFEAKQQAAQAEAQKAEAKDRLMWMQNVTQGLMRVPPDQRQSFFDERLVPTLQAMGLPPEVVQQMTQAPKDDASLQAFGAALGNEEKKLQGVNLGNGGFGTFDQTTGALNVLREPAPIYQSIGENTSLIELPRGGGAPSMVQQPGGGAQPGGGNPRSPEVGKFIYNQLQGVPGLRLGNPGVRSEAEIASLPLSAKDTYHRQGAALDFTAPGQQPQQVIAAVKAKMGSGYDVIYHPENGSYHVEPGPNWSSGQAAQAGPRVVAQGAPKRTGRMATAEERAALGITGSAPVWLNPDGKPDVISTTGGGASPKDRVQLRKEFEALPDVKAFNDVAASYDIISRIAESPPTAANDLSLIFAYMKMLDPGSVVREGEFANAQNTGGIPDQVVNAYNKALNGQRLNPEQRKQFTTTAGSIYNSRKSRYDQQVAQYKGYAVEMGLPETTIQARIPAGPRSGGRARAPGQSNIPAEGLTPQQKRAAQGFRGTTAPAGTRQNPSIPVNQQQFAKLPSGTVFIAPDGTIREKP